MEKDSLIILSVVIGLVVVSTVILEGRSITGEAVELGTKYYKIEADKVQGKGDYSVNEESFSLDSGESKTTSEGVTVSHLTVLSGGTRFELSGACTNVYTMDVSYHGNNAAGAELGGFAVRINGKEGEQFTLREGKSKMLSDKSRITLLSAHKGLSNDDKGAEFELVCS